MSICRYRLDPEPPFELHETDEHGVWVGVTDRLYADSIQSLWVEGYMIDIVGLPTGKLQVVVREGLCDHDWCIEETFS